MLVGVNDFWHTRTHGYTGTIADYEKGYVALLEGTRHALPSTRLVVMEPFVLQTGAVDSALAVSRVRGATGSRESRGAARGRDIRPASGPIHIGG